MAVVLILVQTKQIRIYIYINETIQNTQYKQYKTQSIQISLLPKHPHITKKVKTTIVQVETNTVQDTHQ